MAHLARWTGILLVALAHVMGSAQVRTGVDDFGRACALTEHPDLSVMVEDEWYGSASDVEIVRGPGLKRTSFATVHARRDGEAGQLELVTTSTRAAWFRLRLSSATGYAHVCRFNP